MSGDPLAVAADYVVRRGMTSSSVVVVSIVLGRRENAALPVQATAIQFEGVSGRIRSF
jgi:hypothetical protein